MKKTIIALATAAVFATSANAATVYEQDGTKVEIGGSVRVLLSKEKGKRTDLKNNDSRLEVNASHDLGNGLSALGGVEIRFDGDDTDESAGKFGNPTTNKLFAGLGYEGVGTLTFGKQATNGDDVQLNDNSYVWGGNNNLLDSADKSIKFRSAEWSGFSFGLDYVFGNAEKKHGQVDPQAPLEPEYKYGYQASVFYTRELAQDLTFNWTAGYGVDKEDLDTTKSFADTTAWRTAVQLAYGPVEFGAEYGQSFYKEQDTKQFTNRSLLVSTSFQVAEPSKIYAQWKQEDFKYNQSVFEDGNDPALGTWREYTLPNSKVKKDTLVVGVDYKLHKNVVTYIEYAYESTRFNLKGEQYKLENGKETGNPYTFTRNFKQKDNKIGVGLRVFF
ncbi:porin [Pasteurella sp. PK-2025]|uniref:porin n=1 Tax=Pasteurella sp. PK-2025 TaxID=3413133 RepID=UPI003C787CE0